MTDMALGAAVTRLERAIARLERARGTESESSATAAAALRTLTAHHDRLRERVRETVARLDVLIEAGEGTA